MKRLSIVVGIAILLTGAASGCGPSTEELEAVDYAPLAGEDWTASTPEEHGLDPKLVAEMYYNAAQLETLFGLLVVKDGELIGEDYFNDGSVDQLSARQSITKSYTSALAGIAFDKGHLTDLDQKMVDFFPELESQIVDPRKKEITIRQLLQMRSGYRNEQLEAEYLNTLFYTDDWHWLPHIVDFPLSEDPGSEWQYSEITYHSLGVIVARATDMDLETFARKHLFSPIDAELADWSKDADGYNFGDFEIYVSARDMAKFGQLYLDDGSHEGTQVVSSGWVRESLERHSEKVNVSGWLSGISSRNGYFRDIGYGYGWWAGKAGEHRFSYAAGHGGNMIVILDELDMVIVTTADPLYDDPAGEGWDRESAIIEVVGKFIESLPRQ